MKVDYWAEAPCARDQIVLFAPTLESAIPEDHPVRLYEEILAGCDWSEWEALYNGKRGQPPIHPRVLAGLILYGLTRKVRSSRQLEYMVTHNLDFMYLAEGRSIDHSTFCDFRKKYREPLKKLFRQVNEIALRLGLIRLEQMTLDGTKIKANNDRYETLTAAKLTKAIAALDEQFERLMAEADAADLAERELFETGKSLQMLPPELAKLQERKAKLEAARETVLAADEARRKKGTDPEKNPAQIPTTDFDSKVSPNKEGGYAPNYTPMAAVDVQGGFIVDADVITEVTEHVAVVPTVERVAENYGQMPEQLLADGLFATGETLQEMEARGVEFFTPVKSNQPQEGNPAKRDDPTQPVPPEQWDQLPRNPQSKKLDRSAFVYNEQEDRYYCPQGKPLNYEVTDSVKRGETTVRSRVYRCAECAGCPLAAACLKETAKKGRQISRDEYEKSREAMAAKMATEEGKAVYKKRFHAGEVPFAVIKHIFGLRQFLLRGLESVRTEWRWACTAYNIKKLVAAIARLRAQFAKMIEAAVE